VECLPVAGLAGEVVKVDATGPHGVSRYTEGPRFLQAPSSCLPPLYRGRSAAKDERHNKQNQKDDE
jgi:hypothetical protein